MKASDARGAEAPEMAPGRLGGIQDSGAGFRLAGQAIKGVLKTFPWEVLRAFAAALEKGASYG